MIQEEIERRLNKYLNFDYYYNNSQKNMIIEHINFIKKILFKNLVSNEVMDIFAYDSVGVLSSVNVKFKNNIIIEFVGDSIYFDKINKNTKNIIGFLHYHNDKYIDDIEYILETKNFNIISKEYYKFIFNKFIIKNTKYIICKKTSNYLYINSDIDIDLSNDHSVYRYINKII